MLPVTLTDAALADPVFAGLPRELLTLQWHGDTFDLPDGRGRARELAGLPQPGVPLGRARVRDPVPPRGHAADGVRVGRGPGVRGSRSSTRSGRARSRRCCASSTSAARR